MKRIRPQSLEPIDYQHENDTRALWFSEGVTSTVGDMLLVRAGLIDESDYLQARLGEITELQAASGAPSGNRRRSRASTPGSKAMPSTARRSAASATTTRARFLASCWICAFAS